VGRSDSQVQRLLAQKNTSYDWYTEAGFRSAFEERFAVASVTPIAGTDRTIYHLRSA
jgi:hypothetical protein